MSKQAIVADTNIIVHLLNGVKSVVNYLDGRQVYLSFISEMELLGWSRVQPSDVKLIEDFVLSCYYIDYSYQIKQTAIRYIYEYNLKLPDSFIASSAFHFSLPLFTSDKIFLRVKEIEVITFDPISDIIL